MSHALPCSVGRPRNSEVDRAILEAVLSLLAAGGYQRLSIEAVAAKAGVAKTSIYRRYASKDELIAAAIDVNRPVAVIPDTGDLWRDLDEVLQQAAEADLSELGRQTLALMLGLASTSPRFAQIYWQKYLMPRRKAAAVILERAIARGELSTDLDIDLIFDLMTGLLYKMTLFPLKQEPVESYFRRALEFLLQPHYCQQTGNAKNGSVVPER
jgi:AcrR family transcriptional regulator